MMRDRGPHLSSIRLFALLVAALVGLGCAFGTGGDRPADEPPVGADPRESRRAEPISTDNFADDVNGAVGVAEQYWRQRFANAGRQFAPVRRVFPYTRNGEVECAGEPVPTNNAVYCPAGDFIAYDVNFAVRAFTRVGDAFVYYLLGHEYAHAVQVRLGLQHEFTIQQELQADCMAGAYIGDSIRSNALTVEEGDIEEFRAGLLAVGDDPSVPWFAPGAHGTAQQRTTAFFSGYQSSLAVCGLVP